MSAASRRPTAFLTNVASCMPIPPFDLRADGNAVDESDRLALVACLGALQAPSPLSGLRLVPPDPDYRDAGSGCHLPEAVLYPGAAGGCNPSPCPVSTVRAGEGASRATGAGLGHAVYHDLKQGISLLPALLS